MASPISSCARAATSHEAAYRIDYPLAAARNTRVIALDEQAAEVVRTASSQEWAQAKFYEVKDPGHDVVATDGTTCPLAGELEDSNTVIMVSVTGENSEAAATIGAACKVRGIMTAGLAISGEPGLDALTVLRPVARVLLVPAELDDLVELLRATRA